MKARDLMSTPVTTVGPNTPIPAAAQLLVSRGYTAAPVVEDDRVIGIVTEANLMQGQIHPRSSQLSVFGHCTGAWSVRN